MHQERTETTLPFLDGFTQVLSSVFLLYQNLRLVEGSTSSTQAPPSSSDSPSDSTTTLPCRMPKALGRSHTLSPVCLFT